MILDIKDVSWPGWKTVRLLGRGSYGAVYEIQRDVFGDLETAALKVISIPQTDGEIEELYSEGLSEKTIALSFQTHLKSIVNEYSMMRKMNGCVNVVHCDDVRYEQQADGIGWNIYIKMELLTPLIKFSAAETTEAMTHKIAVDMCHALEACASHGIIHRDIKPQNMFISENGDCKLGDFGIAKTVERTMGGTKIGTFKYMAPEVYNNQPYGTGADIYSLGLVLYWLLNERRMPFVPLPPAQLLAGMDGDAANRRLSGAPIPPPKNGSAEFKRIVLKACAYNPKERYTSAHEMRKDLEKINPVPIIAPIPDSVSSVPAEDAGVQTGASGTAYSNESIAAGAVSATATDHTYKHVSQASTEASMSGDSVIPEYDTDNDYTDPSSQDEDSKKKISPLIWLLILFSVLCILGLGFFAVRAIQSGNFSFNISSFSGKKSNESSANSTPTPGASSDAGGEKTPTPSAPTVQISFHADGGTSKPPMEVEIDKPYGQLPSPTRENYSFAGWYTQPEGGEQITESSVITSEEDLTLYARWEPKTFTIFFHAGGGTVSTASKTATFGEKYGALPTPTRDYYSFVGWFTAASGGEKVSEDTVAEASSDITLYAQWSQDSFTVSFNANGGSVTAESMEAFRGVPFGTLPTPTRENYDFTGWFTRTEDGDPIDSSTVLETKEDITVYAHWEPKTFTVSFNANGGNVNSSGKTVTYGDKYGSLPTPSRDYYHFEGWFTASSGGSRVTSDTVADQTANTTIYAHWTQKDAIWAKASDVPGNAQIVNRKWSYTKTTTTESTNTSMSGYSQVSSYWQETGSGSTNYASFPSTFDTSHSLYKNFSKSAYSGFENATSKRVVSNSWAGYIYWHWMYNVPYSNTTVRFISDRTGNFDKYGKTNSSSYYFGWFYAFTSSVNCKYLDNNYCCNRNQPSYYCHDILPSDKSKVGTPRFFRFDYYKSSYTDYVKVFVYQKTENLESYSKVTAGGDISNVQEWVQYRPK